MRVVCPYTPDKIRAETKQSLERDTPGLIEYEDVSGHNEAYATLLENLWATGEDFAIVEHDIEVHEYALQDFMDCREPWCSNEYKVGEALIAYGLGCVRFRKELMEAEPDAIVAHTALGPGLTPARDWRRLDVRTVSTLRTRGYEPCVHEPPVNHHHSYPPVLEEAR